MIHEQKEMHAQMSQARSMSLKQFSEQYPEFYEENKRFIVSKAKTHQISPVNLTNRSMQNSQGVFHLTKPEEMKAAQVVIHSENDNESQILGNLGNSD